mmetsp:Transcript_103305/g.292680  ORF Transcript_103305/g.292680 Transcript_103305/m.292680 type:complete len:333 (+) Transcript_103305:299-1297(+)
MEFGSTCFPQEGHGDRGDRFQPAPTLAPRGGSPRMLRIEHQGQPFDWFNLDEMGDVVRSADFVNTLRENIVHYFSIPYEWQVIYDDEGLLCTAVDFARAFQSVRPCLRVFDIREMPQGMREQATQKLATILVQVGQSHQTLKRFTDPGAAIDVAACNGGGGPAPRPMSPWPLRETHGVLGNHVVVGEAGPPFQHHALPALAPGDMAAYAAGTKPTLPPYDANVRFAWQDQPVSSLGCIEVMLSKNFGGPVRADRFGFANVPTTDGRGLLVTWIDAQGLLGTWNRAYPAKAVYRGDIVISANGVSGESEAVRAQLQHDTVQMLVQRSGSGACE